MGVVSAVACGVSEDNEVVRVAAYDNFACSQAEDELRCAPERGRRPQGGGAEAALYSVYDLELALQMPVLD